MKLLIVQPHVTEYRRPIFDQLSASLELTVVSSEGSGALGYVGEVEHQITSIRYVEVVERSIFGGRILYQDGLIGHVKKTNPDVVLATANPRYLSYWLLLIFCWSRKIPFYSHGQGLFKKKQTKLLIRLLFRAMAFFSTKYLCYAEICEDSMTGIGISRKKLSVVRNSLINKFPVAPKPNRPLGVLFVGRLREGSDVDLLVEACDLVRMKGCESLHLHIIGDGPSGGDLRFKHRDRAWITWYGKIYDNERISEISRDCSIGCYPGNAGLSVVHYMSLGLVPVVHGDLSAHMGPEPSYVRDKVNGVFFDKKSGLIGLADAISFLSANRIVRERIAEEAYLTYQSLSTPGLAQEILKIVVENHAHSTCS